MSNLDEVLSQLGFSPNEAKVYLAGLELGLASAQEIAQKAGVKRTTCYSVLGYLLNRGVVAKTKVHNKTRFIAEPPERLLSLTHEIQTRLKNALPQLEAIYNKKDTKPKITFFEGPKAIQAVYDDTLREQPAEILEWNTDAYFGSPNVNPHYIEKRVGLGIHARRIAGAGSQWDVKHRFLDEKELAETRVVPRTQFWPGIEVNIYRDKIAFLNYAENMSVIIASKPIAEAMRQAYELSWRGAQTPEGSK